MSMFGGESSGSQVPSQSTGSAPCLIPSAKRQKTQDEVARESNSESNDVSTIQLQNVARLASLEAMHRFRAHDIKMPLSKDLLHRFLEDPCQPCHQSRA